MSSAKPTPPPAPKLSGVAYIPRWFGGVCCYLIFGLGGLISSLTIMPVLRFWPGSYAVKVSRVQRFVSWMFRGFVAMLTFAGVIKVNQTQIKQLNNITGTIVVANHPTLVDVVVLISLMPNVGCVVKQTLWRNPFIRGVLSSAGYIPNRGAALLLEDCAQVLSRGTNLIIFPEGTRTVTGSIINPFARGAANIALRTRSNILPVILRTDVAGLTKQQPWYEIPQQTINMSVEVGDIFAYQTYRQLDSGEAKLARQMTRELEQFYKTQLVHPIPF
ncbi:MULTISPECIES: lysophospholipid acyltransferase family protein [Pseudomonadati]|uniref:1-acyl-sn-glycerol-3-phosphate acyltransferase n=1 Tax=Shewanella aestuarii TaxID=1028752 RepID=A0ABT0L3W0_9GAMM|nr:1-acyl-sn-glycerol-3-phosphate acyltransferase [Shewanella aestuarii]MCL1118264.1 1-acyl-sn-glycerol-3-phosphate acyltransferase [Shewanella aestuarii]GGN80246.1 1-acyl-sn-glycerol-3-phosphate acyltransferase [Shewanella aestuarii]